MDGPQAGPAERSASLEEMECWKHASSSLKRLEKVYEKEDRLDTIGRVNRLLSVTPVGDPHEGAEEELRSSIESSQEKLIEGVSLICKNANQEVSAIDDALERVTVLLALRRAQETASEVALEERGRRCRSNSSSAVPSRLDPRKRKRERELSTSETSASSSSEPHSGVYGNDALGSSEPQARRVKRFKSAIPRQPVLQPGRKVVFRTPGSRDTNEDTWIVAIIIRYIGPDNHGGQYEVEDAEPDEDGEPGVKYTTSRTSLIPLPDPAASPGSPAYLDLRTTFPVGSDVLALYPDTSCFYRATVIAASSTQSLPSATCVPCYNLKFEGEDDETLTHSVSSYEVVQLPV